MDNDLLTHRLYMKRCLELAKLGMGAAAPNPMVGAVLVYQNSIIGEGYHQQFGGPHAEVHALNSVKEEQKQFIEQSTLYVSLEPCSHYGKTPPCTELILKHKIPHVVIACSDPFPEVSGRGIQMLKQAGVKVTFGVLEAEARELNRRFITFHTRQKPWVILKWAQTSDGYFAQNSHSQTWITNAYSQTLVHKWRSEEQAILIGTTTAMTDNPQLNVRLWFGRSPLRIVLDRDLTLPQNLHLFDQSIPTLIVSQQEFTRNDLKQNISYLQATFDEQLLPQILQHLYQTGIQSVMVEGGKVLLEAFVTQNLWNEARIFTGIPRWGKGIPAPRLPETAKLLSDENIDSDRLEYWVNSLQTY